MQPPRLEILAYEPTPLGLLCLRRRELASEPGTLVTEVTLDHEFLMSSLLTDSERALAEIGVSMHGGENLSVLVGGLGLGYTAHAALVSDKTDSVEVVEYLPQVIDWLNQGLIPLSEELNREEREERLRVGLGDVYEFLTTDSDRKMDVILIDVDHSPEDVLGEQSHGFYTVEGLRNAAQKLNPGGVIGVWSYAENSPLAEAMQEVFGEVRIEEITAWNRLIDVEQTDWLFFGRKA